METLVIWLLGRVSRYSTTAERSHYDNREYNHKSGLLSFPISLSYCSHLSRNRISLSQRTFTHIYYIRENNIIAGVGKRVEIFPSI